MDFSPVLVGAETISASSCAISLYVGETAPSGMLSGGASAASGVVSQTVTGGTDAHVYRLRFSVLTSTARELVASSFLPIDEDD